MNCPLSNCPSASPVRRWFCVLRGAGFLLTAGVMVSGCAIQSYQVASLGEAYRPGNVFRAADSLPQGIKRMVVLPMTCDESRSDLSAGRDTLDAVLRSELVKTKKFEIVVVTPETLRAHTGRASWSSEDVLPADFLQWLGEAYGCDAVLFSDLTAFRAYPPLAVGWRLQLVNVQTHEALWASDEVFDAGLPGVMAGALKYQGREMQLLGHKPNEFVMLNSPRCFGQYAAAELLATMPIR
jgi:hypothetical protein